MTRLVDRLRGYFTPNHGRRRENRRLDAAYFYLTQAYRELNALASDPDAGEQLLAATRSTYIAMRSARIAIVRRRGKGERVSP